jgi:hypothetical protein
VRTRPNQLSARDADRSSAPLSPDVRDHEVCLSAVPQSDGLSEPIEPEAGAPSAIMSDDSMVNEGGINGNGSAEVLEPVENVPLFENNFGDVSMADSFCFMCEYGESGARELANPYFIQLHKIISKGATLPIGSLCRIIQRYYRSKLKDHEEKQRDWTLRSIERHLIHHGGLTDEGRACILRNIQFSSIWHLVQNELLVKGETGTLCNLPALSAVRAATQQFMSLAKKQ